MVFWRESAICLFHRPLQHAKRELRAINWCWQFRDDMPECTNVVEMAVRKDVRSNPMLIFFQPLSIRNYIIYTRIIAAWKQKTHINDDDIVVIFNRRHVLADTHLADTANRNHLQRWPWRPRTFRLVF